MKLDSIVGDNRDLLWGVISEGGLSRLLDHYKERPFAIISGFRSTNTYERNKSTDKSLINVINNVK